MESDQASETDVPKNEYYRSRHSRIPSTFTSFPINDLNESQSDSKGFFSKIKSITSSATNAVQHVLPGGKVEQQQQQQQQQQLPVPELYRTPPSRRVSSANADDSFQSPYSQALARDILRRRTPSQHSISGDSPLRYLNQASSPRAKADSKLHKAAPSIADVTMFDISSQELSNAPIVDTQAMSSSGIALSRSASVNTNYSYNPQEHLPGYTIEREPSSDSESIASYPPDYLLPKERPLETIRAGNLGREFWMKDENATECFKCTRPFTAWRRKHHCRICGQIFCSSCTTSIPGQKFNYPGKMRVCLNCLDVIDKYTSSSMSSSAEDLSLENDILAGEGDAEANDASSVINTPIELSFNSAPRPAPRMAIQATRQGESLEIPPNDDTGFSRSLTSGFPLSRRRSMSASDTFNIPDEDRNIQNGDVIIEDDSDEDEQAMSLFTLLNSSRTDEARPEQNRASMLRPRSGTTTEANATNNINSSTTPTGKTNIMRIGQRKKSFSNGRKLANSRSRIALRRSNTTGSSPRKNAMFNFKRPAVNKAAPSIDLNHASISHANAFLEQILEDYELSPRWLKALMDPLIQCAQNIDLDIKGGDHIDIRHYVKLKRIPGGRLEDTQYLNGLVFTRTLPVKTMPTEISNPRILILTFPIEYTRGARHFMSLDPVLNQEAEYLKKLVKRIVALNPQIVLSSNRVSGLAIRLMDDAGLVVIPNIKMNVISRVSRYTQSDIISSMDKLSMNPILGTCDHFEVKSYRFNSTYKTYIFLSGIPKALGCTLILRGGDENTLASVKAVVEFMVYVVFSLKLETSLMLDQFVLVPVVDEDDIKPHEHEDPSDKAGYFHDIMKYQVNKILSSSPFVRYGNPYLLQEARGLEDQLVEMDQEKEALNLKEDEYLQEALEKLNLQIEISKLPGGYATGREIAEGIANEKEQTIHNLWSTQKRQWELSYAQFPDMFSPTAHQCIVTLYSVVCSETATPCVGPEHMAIDFYSDNDMTLGQLVEYLCMTTSDICPDGCGKTMNGHYRSYVHGPGRLNVIVESFPCILPGMQNTILMWSYCKECNNTMPVMPMSSTTWKYSFGKYLELAFWSKKISFRAGMCSHNLYRDHIRYFGLHDKAVRFEYDPICLLEIVTPPRRMQWDLDKEVKIKINLYSSIQDKIRNFYDSVSVRLNSVIIENTASDKVEECREKIAELEKACTEEREAALDHLQREYRATKITELLPLNAVMRSVQENVVRWDCEFTSFENDYFPSEKDITRITAQQLKKIFMEKPDEGELIEKDGRETPLASPDYFPEKPLLVNSEKKPGEEEPRSSPGAEKDKLESSGKEDASLATKEPSEDSAGTIPDEIKPNGELPEEHAAKDSRKSSIANDEESSRSVHDTEKGETNGNGIPSKTEADTSERLGNSLVLLSQKQASSADSVKHSSAPVTRATSPEKKKLPRDSSLASLDKRIREGKLDLKQLDEARKKSDEYRHPVSSSKGSSIPTLIPQLVRQNRDLEGFKDGNKASKKSRPLGESSISGSSANLLRKKLSSKINSFPSQSLRQRFGSSTRELERQLLQNRVTGKQPKVSSLAKHFDQLSREFEKERQRERSLMAQGRTRAFPVAKARPIVEVFKNVKDAVNEENRIASIEPEEESAEREQHVKKPELTSSAATPEENAKPVEVPATVAGSRDKAEAAKPEEGQGEASKELEEEGEEENEEAGSSIENLESRSSTELSQPEQELTHTAERLSLMQTLSRFWADRSSTGWMPLAYPLIHTEHVFAESDIIVREDEPSSLIAFCLASTDYLEKLRKMKAEAKPYEENGETIQTSHGVDTEMSELELTMLKKTGIHLKYQFQEGSAILSCKIFYSEQFDAFRRQCNCDEYYIQSLARCIKFDSSGGKSGAAFLKTLDNRLIIKELSPSEMDAFLMFAPSYFDYMAQAFFHDLPTVLAKIFGFYQIHIRNPITGKTLKMDLIVMENLFYNRRMSRIFDLKGSMRNRHVEQTGRENEVLLDENMVEYIYESPLFVREYAKRLLRTSLFNDTLFLAKMNVMDYSLVIGIDEDSKQLVVGIIDFIRTFTWDKKLESWVKERGLVGGGVKEPTVVSPKQYKNRFREAMERYILMVPDCWYQDY
ncbi:1-phosphatidylinositol 3-phosphate 5-kinase Fab1p [Trichomonascus vanleenenianus]|uniref:1-phosphatidylinositol-3-phosphate 5-kinase n=1 Tax=Trichomonascus vanleenenianus TaxID=2268995 RepID=UPI003ECB19EB